MSAADLEAQVVELRDERATLEVTRTREDVRKLAEDWLAVARARAGDSTGFVLGQHAGVVEMQAVVSEFLLGSPAFAEFVVAKAEAASELSSKAKSAKLAKLDTSIAAAEKQLREERKREAIEEIEREFSEVA